uniref:Fungal lipase-like domain-containing protein n=1 Tax=Panagrolaimus sp. ES5 TaxID=591445 RepID=A0AC34FST4_9BILA
MLLITVNSISIPCAALYKCQTCTNHGGCFFNIEESKCKPKSEITTTNISDIINTPYDCPVAPLKKFAYSDDFARNRAWLFSAASNPNDSTIIQKCLDKADATFHSKFLVPCDEKNATCFAYIALVPKENAMALTFRGSKGEDQMKLEYLNFINHKTRTSKYVDGKVLTYFIDAFEAVWENGVEDTLRQLKKKHPNYELWTFGHSLGASLASIAAFAAVKTEIFKPDEVKSVTMGQIRTGTIEFAQGHDKYVPNSYRVVHAKDAMVQIPLKDPLEIDDVYHHRFEVWYNNNMTVGDSYVINERGDDFSGANTVNITNLSQADMTTHLIYFNSNIETYIADHC